MSKFKRMRLFSERIQKTTNLDMLDMELTLIGRSLDMEKWVPTRRHGEIAELKRQNHLILRRIAQLKREKQVASR